MVNGIHIPYIQYLHTSFLSLCTYDPGWQWFPQIVMLLCDSHNLWELPDPQVCEYHKNGFIVFHNKKNWDFVSMNFLVYVTTNYY